MIPSQRFLGIEFPRCVSWAEIKVMVMSFPYCIMYPRRLADAQSLMKERRLQMALVACACFCGNRGVDVIN